MLQRDIDGKTVKTKVKHGYQADTKEMPSNMRFR